MNLTGLPLLLDSGRVNEGCFLSLPVYGKSLQRVMSESRSRFSKKTVLMIGIQLIKAISNLHSTGNLHLDIKPDNILLDTNDYEDARSSLLTLIDFSISTKYTDDRGNHSQPGQNSNFRGNLLFSSRNQMMCMNPSRRDDIISVMYLLIFLSERRLPWTQVAQRFSSVLAAYESILLVKNKFHQTLQTQQNQKCLLRKLLQQAEDLEYSDKPDYEHFIKQMIREIEVKGDKLDWVMDWSDTSILWKATFIKQQSMFTRLITSSTLSLNYKFDIKRSAATEGLNSLLFNQAQATKGLEEESKDLIEEVNQFSFVNCPEICINQKQKKEIHFEELDQSNEKVNFAIESINQRKTNQKQDLFYSSNNQQESINLQLNDSKYQSLNQIIKENEEIKHEEDNLIKLLRKYSQVLTLDANTLREENLIDLEIDEDLSMKESQMKEFESYQNKCHHSNNLKAII